MVDQAERSRPQGGTPVAALIGAATGVPPWGRERSADSAPHVASAWGNRRTSKSSAASINFSTGLRSRCEWPRKSWVIRSSCANSSSVSAKSPPFRQVARRTPHCSLGVAFHRRWSSVVADCGPHNSYYSQAALATIFAALAAGVGNEHWHRRKRRGADGTRHAG